MPAYMPDDAPLLASDADESPTGIGWRLAIRALKAELEAQTERMAAATARPGRRRGPAGSSLN